MPAKKRSIPKKEYDENRKKADQKNKEIREEIKKEYGKKALEGKHIDDIKPIAKGGSPTARSNKRVVSARTNLKKGAK